MANAGLLHTPLGASGGAVQALSESASFSGGFILTG